MNLVLISLQKQELLLRVYCYSDFCIAHIVIASTILNSYPKAPLRK